MEVFTLNVALESIVGVFFFMLGFLCLASIVFAMLKTRRMSSWPRITATLHEAEARKRVSSGGRADSGGTHWELQVAYTYEVDGRKYSGHRLSPAGQTGGSERWARRALAKIRDQNPLRAYVNPRKPTEAYLTNRVSLIGLTVVLVLGTAFVVFGIAILMRSWGMPSD